MDWPVLIITGIVAITAVVVAFLVDRDAAKRRRKILSTPPDRPGLPEAASPTYLTADEIRQQASQQPVRPDLSQAERDALAARVADVTPIPVGWPSSDFVTDAHSQWAVVDSPVVVVAEAVSTMADVVPIVQQARDKGAGLVVAARRIAPEVLATLSLNALSGRLPCLSLLADDLDQIAQQVHASILTSADLTAGYVPDHVLGRCDLWVSDPRQTWIVPSASDENP